MSEKVTLDEAIATWRAKHQINEDDPIMASLELVRIYLLHAPSGSPESGIERPSYQEFRDTVELLNKCAETFAKQSLDLTFELRRVGSLNQQKNEPPIGLLMIITGLALLAGILIGRC
ncbi:MAG: hypothetical protein JWL59_4835 [Chthoniobacteraceae bacterium]|nr:hypothetical protein [Chthoniobacteraceae bacterium]